MIVQRGSASELTSWRAARPDGNMIVVDDGSRAAPTASPWPRRRVVIVTNMPKKRRRAHQRHPARRDRRRPSRCAAASRSSRAGSFTPGLDEVIVGEQDREPHPGPRDRRHRQVPAEARLEDRRASSRRRAAPSRARSGATSTSMGPIFQRSGGSNSLVRAHEGPGATIAALDRWIRVEPADAAAGGRRSGSTTTTRRARWPSPRAAWRRCRGLRDGHRRRVRGHEHDVRDRGRAHARDRHPARARLLAPRDPVLVRDRVGDPRPRRRRDRLPARVPHERLLDRHRPDRRASARSPSPSASRRTSCHGASCSRWPWASSAACCPPCARRACRSRPPCGRPDPRPPRGRRVSAAW